MDERKSLNPNLVVSEQMFQKLLIGLFSSFASFYTILLHIQSQVLMLAKSGVTQFGDWFEDISSKAASAAYVAVQVRNFVGIQSIRGFIHIGDVVVVVVVVVVRCTLEEKVESPENGGTDERVRDGGNEDRPATVVCHTHVAEVFETLFELYEREKEGVS